MQQRNHQALQLCSITFPDGILSFRSPTVVTFEELNYCTGAANTGKTNLIRAIELLRDASARELRHVDAAGGLRRYRFDDGSHPNDKPPVELTLNASLTTATGIAHYRTTLVDAGGGSKRVCETIDTADAAGGTTEHEVRAALANIRVSHARRPSRTEQPRLNAALKRIIESAHARERLREMLCEWDESLVDIAIGPALKVIGRHGRHHTPSLGLERYVRTGIALLDPRPAPVIALDLPELGVHPDVLAGIPHRFEETTSTIVVATHSTLVSEEMRNLGAQHIVLAREGLASTITYAERPRASWGT